MATYGTSSPYFLTGFNQFYLDVMVNRLIPPQSDDILMQLNNTYQYRPDLLSYDLYQTPNLWWVFYQRNPNTLTKPPFDFKQGTAIFIPKLTTLKSALGF
jgi:hypothetical protein